MGCGSSKAVVAVIDNNDKPGSVTEKTSASLKKTQSLEHFQAKTSKTSLKQNNTKNDTINIENKTPSPTSSTISIIDLNNNNNTKNINHKLNGSKQSLQNPIRKPSSSNSAKSGDSGVYDEGDRLSSAKSHKSNSSVNSKPPSGKKTSSARQRLLRIDDKALEQSENISTNTTSDINMVTRPKTRLGNVAFDLLIDAPETGNMKKKPDRLPALESKRKRSKKVKTKEEIEKKMKEVEERRKLQELEKQMKAKQFQHLAVHTTVQPFTMEPEDEETVNQTKDLV